MIYSINFQDQKQLLKLGLFDSEKSIAIIPFKNLSQNPENQYFADGVAENLRQQLSGIKEFKMISGTTAEKFRGRNDISPEIAKNLDIKYILEGSVQEYENYVRIIVSLINARVDQNVWSEIYDTILTNNFAIQSDIAKKIAGELKSIFQKKI